MTSKEALKKKWLLLNIADVSGAVLAISVAAVMLTRGRSAAPMIVVIIFFWLATAGLYLFLFRCPRCKRLFNFRIDRFNPPMALKCRHCGLPRGATSVLEDHSSDH